MSDIHKSEWDAPGIASYIEALWEESHSDIWREKVAEWMGPQTGKFLDLGCGTARIAQFLKGGQYLGVDASKEMLKIAVTRQVTADQVQCVDITKKLPFNDASFNAALCMEVLRHLSSYEPVLQELARLVKKCVYIVDVFQEGTETVFSQDKLKDQLFPNNMWSLFQFLADVSDYFPGWKVDVGTLGNVAQWAIRIEAPKTKAASKK